MFRCRREIKILLWNGHFKSKTISGLQCVTIILEQLGFGFMLKSTEKNVQYYFFCGVELYSERWEEKLSKCGGFFCTSQKCGYLIL